MSRFRSVAASATLGGALSAVAFGAQAGTDLASSTTVSILVALGAGGLLAFFVLRGRPGPFNGAAAVLLLAVFTAITALSAAWSIAPADTGEEAGRTFAYLVAFAAVVAGGRHSPRAAGAVAGSVAFAGVVVCGWALATRVFPASLGGELLLTSRLGAPFGYWNALGGMAALTVPPTLWLATRRGASRAATALSYPALGLLILTILLTQSRGALAALFVALVIWFALVPLRLRSVPALLLPSVAVAPVAAWALSRDQFTEAFQDVRTQEAVAGDFGLLLVALCAVLLAAGLAVEAVTARRTLSLRTRRRAGIGLAVVACALPLATLASVAMSDRGLGGTVSDRFEELTSETEAPPAGSSRLVSASSSRGEYWRQAGKIFKERPLVGRGANTFGLARLLYREDGRGAAHAHGFGAQTLADLGLVGVLSALALLVAWLGAAARTLGLGPGRRPRPDWSDDRIALTSLTLCAVAFGLHAAIDWTWSIPGAALPALVAAGFVAGRGPLPAVTAVSGPPERPSPPEGIGTRRLAAGAVLVTTALCCWAIWQPQASARASDRALDSIGRGDFEAAEREAADARELDPYSAAPLFVRADALAGQGRRVAAHRALEQAVREHPRDPDTWLRLSEFEFRDLDLPERAIVTVEAARPLDPNSRRIQSLSAEIQAAITSGAPAP
ncbi:MAG TPA: tetratricopeptide repeat protein [Thermoleophilaceae bacterium]|nr:tetratricopeptide repeat protein [Thermoleophilaceae bacterium]